MEQYSLRKKIKSYSVNKTLLKEIEIYLKKQIDQYTPKESKNYDRYEFVITDSLGSNSLNSVSDYINEYFGDDVKRIELRFYSFDFQLSLEFGEDPIYSEIKISIKTQDAAKIARGIYQEIVDMLKSYQSSNGKFHPSFKGFIFYNIFAGICSIALLILFSKTKYAVFSFLPLAFIMPLLFTLEKIFPYTEIKTKKNEKFREWRTWFFRGVLSFILFGSLFVWGKELLFKMVARGVGGEFSVQNAIDRTKSGGVS